MTLVAALEMRVAGDNLLRTKYFNEVFSLNILEAEKCLIICFRVVAGFAPASSSERGVRSKQAAYRYCFT